MATKEFISILPQPKTPREVVTELLEVVFDEITKTQSGNKLMFMPALNVMKMKMSSMDNSQAEYICDCVHKISRMIETETGKLSPYHGLE
jgi:hypothetical protein